MQAVVARLLQIFKHPQPSQPFFPKLFKYLGRLHRFSIREAEAIESPLMLLLCGSPTSIRDQPSLKPPVEDRPCSGIDTAIRHHPTNHHSFSPQLFQNVSEIGVDERVVGVFVDYRAVLSGFGDVGHELPIFRSAGNGA